MRTTQNLIALLANLADYRMLSLSQIAHLHFGGKRSARRRMQQLIESGLVKVLPGPLTQRGGRPENVYCLSREGMHLLQSEKALEQHVTLEQVGGDNLVHQTKHQLLLGWWRIHLLHLCRLCPRVTFQLLPCNAPSALCPTTGAPIARARVMPDDGNASVYFTPDAVFILTDSERSKSVLFFLEVDMGTEPLSSEGGGDIREKILRYKHYFRTGGYKQFEQTWGIPLNGFRLLFLANNTSRHAALCALTRSLAPSGFVWTTTAEQLFADGISGPIWTVGGQSDQGRRSIVGGLAQSCPLPQLGD